MEDTGKAETVSFIKYPIEKKRLTLHANKLSRHVGWRQRKKIMYLSTPHQDDNTLIDLPSLA